MTGGNAAALDAVVVPEAAVRAESRRVALASPNDSARVLRRLTNRLLEFSFSSHKSTITLTESAELRLGKNVQF